MKSVKERHPELKDDLEEIEKCKLSPLYFYNKYARQPNQKILTEEEYLGEIKKWETIARGSRKGRSNFYRQYPLTEGQVFLSK